MQWVVLERLVTNLGVCRASFRAVVCSGCSVPHMHTDSHFHAHSWFSIICLASCYFVEIQELEN